MYITDTTTSKISKLIWNGTEHATYNSINDIKPPDMLMLSGITSIFIDGNNNIYLTNISHAQYINTHYLDNVIVSKNNDEQIYRRKDAIIVIPKTYNIVKGKISNFTKNTKQQTALSTCLQGGSSICKTNKYIFIADNTNNFIGKIYSNKTLL